MKETKRKKVLSDYFRELAVKANAKMAATPEGQEKARLRAAHAREALKRKREERQAAGK